MKKTITFFSVLFALLLLSGNTQAQTDGTMDTGFSTGDGFNSAVFTIAVQPDGKILAGGTFTSYKWITQNRIVRLNADGSIDTSFDTGTGFDATVNVIVLQPDGKILVGGQFTSYDDTNQGYITRLNTDGSIDTSFEIEEGFNSHVNTIVLQPDGKILIVGNFTTYKGLTQNRIVRLNTNGSLDTEFDTGSGFNGNVNTIALQPDGKILTGGLFSTYKGTSQSRIARLNANGSLDTSFDIGTGFNNYINRIALQSDGKILVTGQFSTYQGTSQGRIARLNTDGSLDTSFDTGTGFDANVNAIILQSDGKILFGGNFANYKGLAQNHIARLNTNGSLDTSFDIGTGFNGNIQTIALQADRKILVGGSFNSYKGTSQFSISRLHNTFKINTSANPTEGGTITGNGNYNYGATATLTATANTGYTFVNWTEDGTQVSTDAEYSFTVTEDRDLTANFTIVTLPVTILTFTAKANGNHTTIQWQTASELNNKVFIVYRSTDGVNYNEIARQESKGDAANSYTAYDNNTANGVNYYRLKQKDNNGTVSYLADAVINFSLPATDVKVWQNLVDKLLNLDFAAGKYQNLRLLDVTGKILQQHTLTNTQNGTVLNVDSYPKGIYIIELKGSNGNHIVKILK